MTKIVYTIFTALAITSCAEKIIMPETQARGAEEMEINPVKEHDAYLSKNGKVYGIDESMAGRKDFEELEFLADGKAFIPSEFFVIDGYLYFKHRYTEGEGEEAQDVTVFIRQKYGKVEYLAEADFPEKPEPKRAVEQHKSFDLLTAEYEGEEISIAQRDYDEPMGFISGGIDIKGGALLHVLVGRGTARSAGLLFWPEGKRSMVKVMDAGEFYR